MKKTFYFLALALAILTLPVVAQAETIYGWDLDLTDYGGTVITGVNSLHVSGDATVTQYFGDDGALNDGDAFTTDSSMYTVSISTTNGKYFPPYVDVDSGSSDNTVMTNALYFVASDLSGYVTNVTQIDATTWDVDYVYESGTISLYAGTYIGDPEQDITNVVNSQLVATLDLTYGSGYATSVELGGNALSGDTDLIAQFVSDVLGSLISFDTGDYSSDDPNLPTFLVFDLGQNQDQPQTASLIYGDDNESVIGIKVGVTSAGDVSLVATPEPSTFLILGIGLLGLLGFRKKFRF